MTHMMRFTALPNGLSQDTRAGGKVPVVSAHAAFVLSPDGMLGDFPAALAWPSQAITWMVSFRLGATIVEYPAVIAGADPRRPDWWAAVFRPELPVRSYTRPTGRGLRKVRSFRAARLADRWRDAYAAVAAQVGDDNSHLPVGDDPTVGLFAAFEAAGLWDQDRAKRFNDEGLIDGMEEELTLNGFVGDNGIADPEVLARRDILEFRRFLDRAKLPTPPDTGAEDGDRPRRVSWVRPPELDFHELTTACAAHPALLRPLGLVTDLVVQVDWDALASELGGRPEAVSVRGIGSGGFDPGDEVTVTETTDRTPRFVTDRSPWTRCRADDERFMLAAPAGSDLSPDLLLRLGDTGRFRAEILDVENTTLKAVTTGGTLQLRNARRTRSTPATATTPTSRATGISVHRLARSERFHTAALRRGDIVVAALEADPGETFLDADDVLRGYRIDVRPAGSDQWRSVVLRNGALQIVDSDAGLDTIDLGTTEGWVSDTPVSDADGDLYLSEEQLRWDGWSPVAPKPGKAIDPEDGLGDGEPGQLPGVPVIARYRPAPGSLVPLRYGRQYELRARAVDIAGNGPAPDAAAAPLEQTPPTLFARVDPVSSPDVVMTAPRLPGEETGLVVLRSQTRDREAEGRAGRHLLPPRTTVSEAEKHGVLDRTDGTPDPGRYGELAERDAWALHLEPEALVDPGAVGADADDEDDAEGAARYWPAPGAVPVRYLPDPLADVLHLRSPDGTPFLPVGDEGVRFGDGDWLSASGIRLVVTESDSVSASWDENARIIRVGLPKAHTVPLGLSSGFPADALTSFALAAWLAEGQFGAEWPASVGFLADNPVGQRIVRGRNWLFTPWRPLTLVHAVKDPLRDPEIFPEAGLSVIARQVGQTASQVTVPARWHGDSTGRLDLLARWMEGIDNGPGTEPPAVREVSVVATELDRRTRKADDDGIIETSIRTSHEHGDTKHRAITYGMEATGAFLHHFTQRRVVQFDGDDDSIAVTLDDDTGIALGTVRLTGPISADPGAAVVTFRRRDGLPGDPDEPIAFEVSSDPGENTARLTRVNGVIPSGVPLELTFVTNPISHRSNEVRRDVLASARPAAPDIHSVIPTLDWERSRSGSTVTSRRTTAGVRVWLNRPWWSSGLGEQLAVLYLTGTVQPTPAQAPFVSQWGRDPIHAAGNVVGAINDTSFPLRTGPSVALRTPGGPVVRAVPHEVHYSNERDLWYCDIDLEVGASWPFVRLALARFQPQAIVAADPPNTPADTRISLSPVVLADIVQVAPQRTATVSVGTGSLRPITVSLTGNSFLTTDIDTAVPIVDAHIERQLRTVDSDVDWEVVVPPTGLTRSLLSLGGGSTGVPARWTGTLVLGGIDTSRYRYRVVLEEFERFRTDGTIADRRTITVLGFQIPAAQPRNGRRIVHLDVIGLDGLL